MTLPTTHPRTPRRTVGVLAACEPCSLRPRPPSSSCAPPGQRARRRRSRRRQLRADDHRQHRRLQRPRRLPRLRVDRRSERDHPRPGRPHDRRGLDHQRRRAGRRRVERRLRQREDPGRHDHGVQPRCAPFVVRRRQRIANVHADFNTYGIVVEAGSEDATITGTSANGNKHGITVSEADGLEVANSTINGNGIARHLGHRRGRRRDLRHEGREQRNRHLSRSPRAGEPRSRRASPTATATTESGSRRGARS